ncbi:MAG: right-handed parallel beta-helix repeat-containing protein [Planctomycetota bacterium]
MLARFCAVVSLLTALSAPSLAQTIFVDGDLTTGGNNGSTWADAFRGPGAVHDALAIATPGTEIWLTGGTYVPTDSLDATARFEILQSGVTLRGGFAGTETSPFERPAPGTLPTVLSGDLLGDDGAVGGGPSDNSENVVVVQGSRTTLERIHVAGGTVAGLSGMIVQALTLDRCVFENNSGAGAQLMTSGLELSIRDCRFRSNGGDGLDLWVSKFGVPSERFEVVRCSSTDNGGNGFRIVLTVGALEISHLVSARNGGYGILFPTFDEVLLAPAMYHCTVVGNGLGGVRMESCACIVAQIVVADSIIWGNGSPEVSGVAFPQRCIVSDRGDPDPLFVDEASGDYSLSPTSPAIDRSELSPFVSNALDAARQHRDVDVSGISNGLGTVDLGAFEFTGSIGDHGGCDARANSTGEVGRLFARGSEVAADNGLQLRADRLPPQQFGLFLASRLAAADPFNGGLGTLCLGGTIGRFNGPGQVRATTPAGTLELDVDLTRIPEGGAFAAVQPGETWRFQLWHRDVPATNQLTGVVAVRFR